jgi:hypothetical protein
MSIDKELLELAAKAAGYEVKELASKWICQGVSDHTLVIGNDRGGDSVFDPLTDDGDALRLAVRLQLDISNEQVRSGSAGCGCLYNDFWVEEISQTPEGDLVTQDDYAATRRAIVRAAAEIGKGMP